MKEPAQQIDSDEYLALPPSTTWAQMFGEGAMAPWRGWKFMGRHRDLWQFAILPTVINIVITGLVLFVFLFCMIGYWVFVGPWFTEGQSGWSWWLWFVAAAALFLLLLLISAVSAVITWKLSSGILCGYFYGKLAEQVEERLGLSPDEIRSISFLYETVDTVIDVTLLVLVNLFFLLLNVVPLVGGVVALAGSTYFTWIIMGTDYLAFPLALRGVRRMDQLAFARRHQPYVLGLGAAVSLIEFIPIIGALFLTTATVGGVLLHRRIQAAERLSQESASAIEPAIATASDSV